MTITAYEVHAKPEPHSPAEVVDHCTSEEEARHVARTRSEALDATQYVIGPDCGFRQSLAKYHRGAKL